MIACRVTFAPSDRAVADSAPPPPSFFTTASRVSSPSAEKTAAAAASRKVEILSEILGLLSPSAFVHAKRARAPMRWHPIKAGLDDGQQRALGDRLELKFHE